ncbi:hypothetical protein [Aggregatibacter kilianii]|jgi:hypothetical protein|uniref:hypothetical protein n=1 Tax=Aggregatibacter kilianii TaxID=2025884 RepID=UPI000D65E5AC|nr:hypothetical protein [Aggregatibacter kilianii]
MLDIVIGVIISVIVNLCLKPWITAYSKKWGEISAQLATKEDLKEITHSIESAKKNAEIDAQLVRKEDLKELTEAIESVKAGLERRNIEYQIRYSKMYEKSILELEKVFNKFLELSLWAKNIEIESNSMRGSCKNEFFYEKFLDLDKKLIEQKTVVKKAFIWLPDEIIKEVDECIIYLSKEYKRIKSDMDENDSIQAGHVFQQYFNSYIKIFFEMENKIISIVKKSSYYSLMVHDS